HRLPVVLHPFPTRRSSDLLDSATSCEIRFWPWLDRFGEPDMLLLIRDERQQLIHVVVVEAKLHSAKSGDADADEDEGDETSWHPDRKSTRLNSSHQIISYA